MVANQKEHSKLEQRFVIKFSAAENSKPSEIYENYRRKYDGYREVCFSKIKILSNELNMGCHYKPEPKK